jgi:UPF0755 protein
MQPWPSLNAASLKGLPAWLMLTGMFLLLTSGLVWMMGPGAMVSRGAVEVQVTKGMSVAHISHSLKSSGVIHSDLVFRLMVRLSGDDQRLRAGTYRFAKGSGVASVVEQMRSGQVLRYFVTIPEGKTSAQAMRILSEAKGLMGDVSIPAEGAILPETYQYERGETRTALLQRMQAASRKTLDDLWIRRNPKIPLKSKEEALILASVVEKETGLAAERPKVAAVFVNRLRKGMRLESDPTVVYGVSKGEPLGRGIRKSELEKPTPWNTYLMPGLPTTPIANPGRAAIEAVLNPAQTDDLFFVADGTGGHAFAPNYEAHLDNVARWRQIEKAALAIRP